MNEFIAPQFPKFERAVELNAFPSPAKHGAISTPLSLSVYCSYDGIAVGLSVGNNLVIDTRGSEKCLEPGDEMVLKGTLDIKTI